jgi:polysaccharide export outer membrane protein
MLLCAVAWAGQGPTPEPTTGDRALAQQQGQPGRPALQRRNPRYRLERGDVFEIQFPYTPDFNQTLTVQPDGYVALRDLGDFHVEGQTVPELAETLTKAYAKILQNPVINIVLKVFETPYFVVFGEVVRPGKYELKGDTTVVQALAIASGFNDNAKHSQVVLFRRVSNEWMETKLLNVKEMLSAKNLSEDLHMQPGDLVYVPKNTFSKITRYVKPPSTGVYLSLTPSALGL